MRHPVLIASAMICGMACTLAFSQGQPAPKKMPNTGAATVAPPPEAQTPVGTGAELRPTQGNQASGMLNLISDKDGVRIAGSIKGLKPNAEFGFHVHEKGDCSAPDGSSAGGHFNPGGQPHGKPGSAAHHLGDMPSIRSNGEGIATVEVRLPEVTLGGGQPNDVAGKALVLHEKADDYKTQPSGNSGSRIACGVIK
jgi:Cu-Zn family superoxide dismutase